jgi:hypothetical protein
MVSRSKNLLSGAPPFTGVSDYQSIDPAAAVAVPCFWRDDFRFVAR